MAGLDHENWRFQAACAGSDPELWFDPDPTSAASRVAVKTCNGCPVAAECFAAALKNRESCGIWAGRMFGGKGSGRKGYNAMARNRTP